MVIEHLNTPVSYRMKLVAGMEVTCLKRMIKK